MDKDVRHTCDAKLESKRPYLNTDHAITLAKNIFHLNNVDKQSSVKEFDSYDDRNFYMKGRFDKTKSRQKDPEEFVFKVLNFAYSENVDLVDGYTAIMLYLKKEGFRCPCPVKAAVNGNHYVMCKFPWKSSSIDMNGKSQGRENNPQDLTDGIIIYSGQEYDRERECVCAVWLLDFIKGKGLHEIPCSSQVLNQCGAYLAKLHVSLKKFSHTGFDRPNFVWDVRKAPTTVKQYLHVLKDEKRIELIEDGLQRFCTEVLPGLQSLPKQVIHGDWNEHNILASQDANGDFCITGFLDMGDTINSYRVLDVAISMMYFCHLENAIGSMSPVEAAGHVLAGYQSVFPLSEVELDMLHASIAARFCQSLVYGAYMYTLYPENEYLLFSAAKGWKIFEEFLMLSKEEVVTTWRNVCKSL